MDLPAPLAAFVRWLHKLNVFTRRRICGRLPHPRFGWSAQSWWASEVREPRSAASARFRRLIDGIFGPEHCRADYQRILAGQPLRPGWREFLAALFVTLPLWLLGLGLLALAGWALSRLV